jgi:Cd2+/Zn2+-exporting ATPase
MDDDLGKIARFVRLSRATHAVLVQNLVLVLGIKAGFLAITLMGMGTMWMAVFAEKKPKVLVRTVLALGPIEAPVHGARRLVRSD